MRRILEKLFCCHDWEKIHITSYPDRDVVLLKCKKCGRLAKRSV